MKSARMREYGMSLVLEDIPVPDVLPGEIPVQVRACGMCRSDVQLVDEYFRKVTIKALTDGKMLEVPGDGLAVLMQSNAPLKAALERSARKRAALLDRDDAAEAVHPSDQSMHASARIRALFGIQQPSIPACPADEIWAACTSTK